MISKTKNWQLWKFQTMRKTEKMTAVEISNDEQDQKMTAVEISNDEQDKNIVKFKFYSCYSSHLQFAVKFYNLHFKFIIYS